MKETGAILTNNTRDNETCWCTPNSVLIDEVLKPAYQDYLKNEDKPKDKFEFEVYDKYIRAHTSEGNRLKKFVLL